MLSTDFSHRVARMPSSTRPVLIRTGQENHGRHDENHAHQTPPMSIEQLALKIMQAQNIPELKDFLKGLETGTLEKIIGFFQNAINTPGPSDTTTTTGHEIWVTLKTKATFKLGIVQDILKLRA